MSTTQVTSSDRFVEPVQGKFNSSWGTAFCRFVVPEWPKMGIWRETEVTGDILPADVNLVPVRGFYAEGEAWLARLDCPQYKNLWTFLPPNSTTTGSTSDVCTGKVTRRVRDDSKKRRTESDEDGKSGQRANSTLGNSVFSWHNSSRATSMLADPIDSSTSRGDETPPSPPASYAYIPGSRLRSSPPLTTEELWAASGL